MDFDTFRQRLEAYLQHQTGGTAVITGAQQLAGGASRDTWKLEVELAGTPQSLVLRKDHPTQMFEGALTREQEYRMMDAAHKSGVRVAAMRWYHSDPDLLGSPFFIMDFVAGVSVGRQVIQLPELAAARSALPQQMAEQLALIHRMNPAAYGIDFLRQPAPGSSPALDTVRETYRLLDDLGVSSPPWEFALRWAEHHAPDCAQRTFIHGDFRLGNLLVDAQGLAAVIDWEFAHVGDPLEELAYPCMRDWRFGNGRLHFAGLSDRETFLRHYEAYSGRQVDRAAVDWWEIMGNIRWGIICMSQAQRHLSGKEQSVELASLGRRSAEMQLEALRLIERTHSAL